MDTALTMPLLPEAARGYTGSPGLAGHREGGGFAQRFSLSRVEQQPQGLRFRLDDPVARLELDILLTLDADSDVASLSSTLTNTGDTAFHVDWFASATLPLPPKFSEVLSHHGRWGRESQPCRRRIGPGRLDISNLHGRTSHEHSPGLIIGDAGFNEDHGEVLFAHLAWSGNFSLRVERHVDGLASLQTGVLLLPGEGALAAGATLESPPLLFTRGCRHEFVHPALPSLCTHPGAAGLDTPPTSCPCQQLGSPLFQSRHANRAGAHRCCGFDRRRALRAR